MDKFFKALNFRHACKIFDESKKISKDDILYILESARLAPSSFGMEHWRFIVIENQNLKEKLRPVCWNQPQITTCSFLVAIVSKKALVQDENYINKMFARKNLNKEQTNAYIQKYKNFLKTLDIKYWSEKQCYIALENMLLASAFKEIDSCAIEGFEKEKVEKILDIDPSKEDLAVMATFGYRLNPQPPKKRLPLEEITTFI